MAGHGVGDRAQSGQVYTVRNRENGRVIARNLRTVEVVRRFGPPGEGSAGMALIRSLTVGARISYGPYYTVERDA